MGDRSFWVCQGLFWLCYTVFSVGRSAKGSNRRTMFFGRVKVSFWLYYTVSSVGGLSVKGSNRRRTLLLGASRSIFSSIILLVM